MKRQPNKPEKFDTLELFTAISREKGFRIDIPSDREAFHRRIGESLKATLSNPNILHGKRVETMFAHVVGALGHCKYIKQEDSGVAFASSDEYTTPDYRIVSKNDELFLVEVKNFHMKKLSSAFKIRRSYLNKLQAYAEINRADLKIAVYFSKLNQWVLLSPESFFEQGRNLYIDFPHAMARNEMSTFGDRMIATLHPLRFVMLAAQEGAKSLISDDGATTFTIEEVKMSCGGRLIENALEAQIAFYLIRYGEWVVAQDPAVIVANRIAEISFSSTPNEVSNDQDFEIIGNLSSMISNAFRELTVDDGSDVVSLDVKYDPEFFSLAIPKDYDGEALPIWQIELQPNLELLNSDMSIDTSA